MLPADVEIQLISRVKEKQDSAALMEIVEAQTGTYMSVVNKFSFLPPIERQELIDHKDTNIYSYVMDFNPDKGTKLSTFVYNNISYQCLNLLREPQNVEINDEIAADENFERSIAKKEFGEVADYICDCAADLYDERFVEIFRLRHLSGPKKMSWRKIGTKLNLSYERVRQIYFNNIEKLKHKIQIL